MKALSIRQPWTELILLGIKDVENRSWTTDHRGTMVIHSARTLDVSEDELAWYAKEYSFEAESLVYGALVGTVEVVDVKRRVESEWYIDGNYGWVLENPQRLDKPVAMKGQRGLFEVKLP